LRACVRRIKVPKWKPRFLRNIGRKKAQMAQYCLMK
jgi:hypothetical protein